MSLRIIWQCLVMFRYVFCLLSLIYMNFMSLCHVFSVWLSVFLSACHIFSIHFQTLFAPWPPPVKEQNTEETHSNENLEKLDNRPLVIEETVPVMFPYNPPDVDHQTQNKNFENTIEESITEITIIPRSYSELESHYAEEPISHINPSDPPPVIYSAPWITEGWEKGTKGPDPNPPDFSNTSHTQSKEISINNKGRENERASNPTSTVEDISVSQQSLLACLIYYHF